MAVQTAYVHVTGFDDAGYLLCSLLTLGDGGPVHRVNGLAVHLAPGMDLPAIHNAVRLAVRTIAGGQVSVVLV
jgi:hypothetical protein